MFRVVKLQVIASLFILLSTFNSVCSDAVFHVHKKGKDIPDCLEQNLYTQSRIQLPCQSLKYLANNLYNFSDNITILIEGHLSVRDLVVFKDSRNISIREVLVHFRANWVVVARKVNLAML